MSNTPGALIAMSGGVDSTVAAYLMKQAGCRCMGATMRLYQNEDLARAGSTPAARRRTSRTPPRSRSSLTSRLRS